MVKNILKVKELEKSYGGRKVVNGLSFSIAEGEVIGLIGPNGAGKTTSFYMTMGLIRPDRGQVIFHGQDVTGKSIDQRAKMGMGYLAQEPSVFCNLTVEQNILCILETLHLSKAEKKQRVQELLAELNLTHLAKKRASTLSGGERRRLEITRALVTKPTFLLLDEPFANIDPLAIADVKAMIRILAKKGISVLITDHNAREIFSIVDRCYLMRDGKLFLEGTVQELLQSQEAKQYYLGSDFVM
ncbi:MAG: LPS export ABC transporter ATP-binding protein [Chlamydiales bacterium]